MRDLLAGATADAHAALHRHPWLARLSGPGLDRRVYGRILFAYRQVFLDLEARRAVAGLFPGLTLSPQLQALEEDLAFLGEDPGEVPGAAPASADPALVLGGLYVLHGAGFGGRHLAARVAANLPEAPRAYLSLGTSPDLWRSLKAALQEHAQDDEATAALIRGALATFAKIDRGVHEACAPLSTIAQEVARPARQAH